MLYDFQERLTFSQGIALEQNLIGLLLDSIPGSTQVVRASPEEDRAGVDYWINRRGLPPVAVDVKHNSYDPIARWREDSACIETTSVYVGPPGPPWRDEYRLKPGWTIDETKRADLVVYTWPVSQNHRRFWVLYFPALCRAAQENWRLWAEMYGEKAAKNNGYVTLSVHPPRHVIAAAMRKYMVGVY